MIETLKKIVDHNGDMFGATRKECGNYRELSLTAAKIEAQAYLDQLLSSTHTFQYPTEKDAGDAGMRLRFFEKKLGKKLS